ncbi:sigma-70 family RNA polymerase sigma factor [Clostridium ganghwense]|uniref:Sigma-70 family RNA polymerase sigma factor n=1 Tax=Clostridium ganghwense TaxID=312089 RepID=A0ABT4CQ89_9CLOT|nr:sigma-70 family RNA polymerase sigma factor [Clostridium ganghwense]MCY6371228.1 sigma-70 family RNA polymerase sigma factor [Clostridium ganghwense]
MEDIIRKAKLGDEEAVACIINKYKNYILKKAWQLKIPGYDFEDLVQHGYLSIIKAVHMYKLGSRSYNGYFINSIDKNFYALLKGKIKHYREVADENILNKDEQYDFTLEDEVIAYEEILKLRSAVEKLVPEEREVIEKHYLMEKSYREIAVDINKTVSQVRYLRKKGIDKLKEEYKCDTEK